MALVAEATAAVSTATSTNLELLMESDGVSLSSSEMSATEGTEMSTEESANVSSNSIKDGNQLSSSTSELNVEQVEMEAAETRSDQQLMDNGGEEMTVIEPAETHNVIVDANNEGANKENSLEESPVILPGNTVEVGSSVEESCTMSPCEILTEENVAAEEIKPADLKPTEVPEDVKILTDTKLFGVKTEIDKLEHKSHTGVSSLTDVKKELSGMVCELKRSELESLIVDKIIEAIAIHSDVGALNQKLIQCNTVKDRLFHKVSSLQAQVVELTKAVRSVSENVGRNQKPVNKANQPIRFYRSVGVQVVLDSSPMPLASRQGVQSQQRVDVTNKSVLKSGTNKTPLVSVDGVQPSVTSAGQTTANGQPLSVIGNVNPGLKRPLKPTVTVADVAKQIDQNKTRRICMNPMGTSPATTPIKTSVDVLVNGRSPQSTPVAIRQPTTLVTSQPLMRNPAAVAAMNTIQAGKASMEPGIVDLTDDDVTPVTAIPKTIITTSPQTTIVNGKSNNVVLMGMGMGGLPYRLASPAGQQSVQLITQNGQSYQILQPASTQFSVRPINIQAINGQPTAIRPVPTTAGTSQIFVRGVVPQSQTTVTPVISAGQILMRSMKPVTTITPVQVGKQPQVTVTPRLQAPQVVVTTGPTRTSLTNGTVVTRVANFANSSNTVTRVVAQPVNKVTVKPVEIAKKFVLPPLPPPAVVGNPRRGAKDIPPRPELTLTEQNDGIVLSWNLKVGSNHADIQTYQIYACQEPLFNSQKSGTASWKRVGDVKALPLPMACTLSQFTSENRYHFIVRGVDVYNRTGPFCEASAITLSKKS